MFFEIAALHPDKGYLEEKDIVRRVYQFYNTKAMIIERCAKSHRTL